MAGTDTISVYRGEDVQLDFTMNPVENITGWPLTLTVQGAPAEHVIEKAGTIVNGPSGTFNFVLTATETDIRAGVYQYDVWRTGAGSERLLAAGTFNVLDAARKP